FAGQDTAEAVMDEFSNFVLTCEADYAQDVILDESEGAALAIQLAEDSKRPIVLVDTQDNPGAGGTGDTTGLIKALVRAHAKGAVVAVLYDPEVASLAHERGLGARIDASIGGRSGPEGVTPLEGEF